MYNCKELIMTLWDIRHKSTKGFTRTDVLFSNPSTPVYSRESEITVYNWHEKEGQPAALVYSDQNPLGYSEQAKLVREGYLRPQDVGWLYLKYPNIHKKLWLAKIVKGSASVIWDCKYDAAEKIVRLYPQKRENYHKVIPITSVPM